MPLSAAQQAGLDAAIADYLKTKGFEEAATAFMEAVSPRNALKPARSPVVCGEPYS